VKMYRHVLEGRRRGVKGYGEKNWSRRQIIQGWQYYWAGLLLMGWAGLWAWKRYVTNECTSWRSVVQGSDRNRRV
jgi:hypothetical protein